MINGLLAGLQLFEPDASVKFFISTIADLEDDLLNLAGVLPFKIANENQKAVTSSKFGARRFMSDWNVQGPTHHCAAEVGHNADKIEKFGFLLRLESVRVC